MSVEPKDQGHRCVPFYLRQGLVKAIQEYLENDIVERVQGVPTTWVSPIVPV